MKTILAIIAILVVAYILFRVLRPSNAKLKDTAVVPKQQTTQAAAEEKPAVDPAPVATPTSAEEAPAEFIGLLMNYAEENGLPKKFVDDALEIEFSRDNLKKTADAIAAKGGTLHEQAAGAGLMLKKMWDAMSDEEKEIF